MKLHRTALPGVLVIEPVRHVDHRGWFMESFNEARFEAALADAGLPAAGRFVQDSHSCSRAGVLRGLHYQLPPRGQGKLVRVVSGRAFDVVVDVRKGSPTFGRWTGHELDPASARQVWIPPGFAHGFLALQDDTQLLYKTTDSHSRDHERAIRWDDPEIGIDWPAAGDLRMTDRDASAPRLRDAEPYVDAS